MCQIMGFWDMSQDPMMKTSLKPVFSRHSCKSFSVIQSGIGLQGRRRLERNKDTFFETNPCLVCNKT